MYSKKFNLIFKILVAIATLALIFSSVGSFLLYR